MKKIIVRLGAFGIVCLLILVVVLTMSLDSLIKKGVETVGPQITQTEMKLDGAKLSLLSGSGTLNGFLLGNPEGYKTASAIQVGEVSVGVKPRSILSDKIHVTHVRVQAPEITFEGTLGTKNNLSEILDNVNSITGGTDETKEKTEPKNEGATRKLQVDEFLISGAKVNVSMKILGGKDLSLTLPDIRLTALGTGPEGITAGELTKKILSEVTVATLKAVQDGVTNLGKGAADQVKKAASEVSAENLEKATKGIGDLFKKKE